MPQSNVIFGFLAVAFVVFITMRGELRLYMGFLLADPVQPNPTATQAATSAEPAKAASDNLGSTVGTLASFAQALVFV